MSINVSRIATCVVFLCPTLCVWRCPTQHWRPASSFCGGAGEPLKVIKGLRSSSWLLHLPNTGKTLIGPTLAWHCVEIGAIDVELRRTVGFSWDGVGTTRQPPSGWWWRRSSWLHQRSNWRCVVGLPSFGREGRYGQQTVAQRWVPQWLLCARGDSHVEQTAVCSETDGNVIWHFFVVVLFCFTEQDD